MHLKCSNIPHLKEHNAPGCLIVITIYFNFSDFTFAFDFAFCVQFPLLLVKMTFFCQKYESTSIAMTEI